MPRPWSSGLGLLCLLLPPACDRAPSRGEGELDRSQCVAMVRRIDRLQSSDQGGLHTARQAAERSSVQRCLVRGTEVAYRCVMQARDAASLRSCEILMR